MNDKGLERKFDMKVRMRVLNPKHITPIEKTDEPSATELRARPLRKTMTTLYCDVYLSQGYLRKVEQIKKKYGHGKDITSYFEKRKADDNVKPPSRETRRKK